MVDGRDRCLVEDWPPLRGEYTVGDPASGVAVCTLSSQLRIRGAALCGPCRTENLGIEKIVANVISNCHIRFLILCGVESRGHLPGETLLAMHKHGIDGDGRIIGSRGAIPFIQNIPAEAVQRFRAQVEVVDHIGLEDVGRIEELVEIYSRLAKPYPDAPFRVVRGRSRASAVWPDEGDLLFGPGVIMETASWLIEG